MQYKIARTYKKKLNFVIIFLKTTYIRLLRKIFYCKKEKMASLVFGLLK